VVMPLAMVKITSGNIDAFDFDIYADRTSARGRVSALYDNLKISILKVDTVFYDLKQRPIATLYANLFIVKHNNPDIPGGQPRSIYVNYSRTPETPFFKSIWQTLLSGIKPCIGLDKKAKDAAIAMQNELAANKQNRKIKKEQRLQRRAERHKKREEEKLDAPPVE
jgi:hypothetical protein